MGITINVKKVTEDLSQYAKKTDVPSLDGYAKESWVETKGYLTEHQSLVDYAKTSDLSIYEKKTKLLSEDGTLSFNDITGDFPVSRVDGLQNTLTEITDKTRFIEHDGVFIGTLSKDKTNGLKDITDKTDLIQDGKFTGTVGTLQLRDKAGNLIVDSENGKILTDGITGNFPVSRVDGLENTLTGITRKTDLITDGKFTGKIDLGNVNDLTDRLTSVEGTADAATSKVGELTETVNGFDTRITTTETKADTATSNVSTLNTTVSSFDNRINEANTAASNAQTSVRDLSSAVEEFDGRIKDAENNAKDAKDKTGLINEDGVFTGKVIANNVTIDGKDSLFTEKGEFSGTLSKDVVTKLDIPSEDKICDTVFKNETFTSVQKSSEQASKDALAATASVGTISKNFGEKGEFIGKLSETITQEFATSNELSNVVKTIPNNERILEIAEGSTKFAEVSAVTAVGTRINTLADLSLNGNGIDMTQNGNTLTFRESYDNATFKATYLFQNRGKSITSGNSIIPGCRVVLEITANTGYKINGSGYEYWQIKTKGGTYLPLSQNDIVAISSEEVVNLIGSGYTAGHTYLCFIMPTTIIQGQLEYTGTIEPNTSKN